MVTLDNIETGKNKLYRHKIPTFSKRVGIEEVLVSNQISLKEKRYNYFIGYLYSDKLRHYI